MSDSVIASPQVENLASTSQPVVRANGLGIEYRVYRRQIFTLKEAMLNLFRGYSYNTFWALNDVSFEIKAGESVGIVGPNGAGKSTLAKAVARVLPPSAGALNVTGTVAPLIELGGGFNPELTGRENIFLNGAIMGRSKEEMQERVDRIIDFAEVREFIDAPLRTFSSGMRSRLGFALATDVNPDILILDEVFSVGDMAFQEKARARMRSFFGGDKIVLMVSHSLGLVRQVCDRVIYLRKGQVICDDKTEIALKTYEQDASKADRA